MDVLPHSYCKRRTGNVGRGPHTSAQPSPYHSLFVSRSPYKNFMEIVIQVRQKFLCEPLRELCTQCQTTFIEITTFTLPFPYSFVTTLSYDLSIELHSAQHHVDARFMCTSGLLSQETKTYMTRPQQPTWHKSKNQHQQFGCNILVHCLSISVQTTDTIKKLSKNLSKKKSQQNFYQLYLY